jgi:hypothetical protein
MFTDWSDLIGKKAEIADEDNDSSEDDGEDKYIDDNKDNK